MNYLRVRNWTKFQHYKKSDESASWIKFYTALLSDYEFNQISEVNQARLLKIWLLAAKTGNRIPDDPKWVARQIGAKSIDLDLLVSRGFLEHLYSESREALAPAEQRRSSIDNSREQKNTNGNYEIPEHELGKLLNALTDSDEGTEKTVRARAKKYKCTEGDVAWARECATGPGVQSPTRVAMAELKKRGEARLA